MPLLRARTLRVAVGCALRRLAIGGVATAAGAAAQAQDTSPRSPTAELPAVEVKAARPSDTQARRESTAAKIVVGREEIERYGDTNLGDVLKRLPGVTLEGRPGRGGEIRMRGLDSGHTQILLDGQRIPPGFSLDSLTPEQVERIEILRAPTAETGTDAIGGTINIVTREGLARRINEVRLTAGVENGRLQPGASWTRNDLLGPFIYNYSMSVSSQQRRSDATTTTLDRNLSDGAITLNQHEVALVRERRQGMYATGRLQWRGDQGIDSLMLTPVLIYGTGVTFRSGLLTQTEGAAPVPYDTAVTDAQGRFALGRLTGELTHRLEAGGRLEWKLSLAESRIHGAGMREETTAGVLSRTLDDSTETADRNLLASTKFVRVLDGDHSLVAGAEGEANRHTERHRTVQNGVPLLTDFGDTVGASSTRLAAYAQDEWSLTPQWAMHAGLRWDAIATRGSREDGEGDTAASTRNVWAPLLHAVWRPQPDGRDQVRMSLTRSYRSAPLTDLIGRPNINTRYPAPGPNTPTQADRAGNPGLRPELAAGVDVAFEHYLPRSGLLSANVFRRQIRNYMRRQTMLENVSWAPDQPRWVSRPQNIGDAMTQGIELEAKLRLTDLIVDAPQVDVRANASMFRSRVKSVPGPDNRIDQQPAYTGNLGADYRVPGWPLTFGGNLNWNPAYDTRFSDIQTASQGRKVVVDAYALWVFSPSLQLRVSASNLSPRDYVTGDSVDDLGAGNRETSATTSPTYLNVQARLEIKL